MELHASTKNTRVKNTSSRHFGSNDINNEVSLWDNSVGAMVVKYRKGLDQVFRGLPPPVISIPDVLRLESDVVTILDRTVIPTVRRMIASNNLNIRKGDFFGNDADIVVFNKTTNKLILVGDVKVGWKFQSEWRTESKRHYQQEYRQVVSQIHHYMRKESLRYGFIITNREFLMFRRGTKFGVMEQGEPVAWDGEGVVLGMWGLIQMAMGEGELGTSPEGEAVAKGDKEKVDEVGEVDDGGMDEDDREMDEDSEEMDEDESEEDDSGMTEEENEEDDQEMAEEDEETDEEEGGGLNEEGN